MADGKPLQCECEALREQLKTERMSADKTHDHNNRLINEIDRLKATLYQIAYGQSSGWELYQYIAREALK